ncbi:UPF0489 family protein [Flavobacterium johnsoniae]|uniref:UPF0489 family protein n=1 Tax=Flavobacterium johnsoniae TaxID=986 RepID=UPI0025AF05F2|nr:hypothetical protein [Flavobacterium johnsoniae]WJS96797.1 UPF0489 family protein [Flavobacterium johnsoniae]
METILFNGKKSSDEFELNLLCNEGKIYLMDNHLAASWCWLKKIDIKQQYNFLHIDRHYDLLDSQLDSWIEALQTQNINMVHLTIEELVGLRYEQKDMVKKKDFFPIFRWDSYITIFDRLYPGLLALNIFATQKNGDLIDEMEISEIDAWYLQDNLSYRVNKTDRKWIINLDIDYFFTSYDDNQYIQLYTDEFIIRIAQEIRKSMENVAVLTIALSPEMCGSWENSEKVAKLILQELDINWQI